MCGCRMFRILPPPRQRRQEKEGDAAAFSDRGVSPPVGFRPSSEEEERYRARALDGRAVVERAVGDRSATLILAFPDGQVARSDADDIGRTIRREAVGDCAGVNRPRGRDALAPGLLGHYETAKRGNDLPAVDAG